MRFLLMFVFLSSLLFAVLHETLSAEQQITAAASTGAVAAAAAGNEDAVKSVEHPNKLLRLLSSSSRKRQVRNPYSWQPNINALCGPTFSITLTIFTVLNSYYGWLSTKSGTDITNFRTEAPSDIERCNDNNKISIKDLDKTIEDRFKDSAKQWNVYIKKMESRSGGSSRRRLEIDASQDVLTRVTLLHVKTDLNILKNAANHFEEATNYYTKNEMYGPSDLLGHGQISYRIVELRRALDNIHRYLTMGHPMFDQKNLVQWYYKLLETSGKSKTSSIEGAYEFRLAMIDHLVKGYSFLQILYVADCQQNNIDNDLHKSCYVKEINAMKDIQDLVLSRFGVLPSADLADLQDEASDFLLIQHHTGYALNPDGTFAFDREWADFALGFGDPSLDAEFYWRGLQEMHELTKTGEWELLVRLRWADTHQTPSLRGKWGWIIYSGFRIGAASEYYTFTIESTKDSSPDWPMETDYFLTKSGSHQFGMNGCKFTTKDLDNDSKEVSWYVGLWTGEKKNCAEHNGYGWWFNECSGATLNGNGMFWNDGSKGHYVTESIRAIRQVEESKGK